MKLIPWNPCDEIEAYTTTKEIGDISLKNSNEALNNRYKLADLLNTSLDKMVAPRQTHTTNFQEVSLKDGGTNMKVLEHKLEDVDATYTKDKDLYLLSFHADCTPVLIYCPDTKIICAIHAGWSGTVQQIVSKTLRHLASVEQCNHSKMLCYIGPCICRNCLEVQQDVIDKVLLMDFDTSPYYKKTDDIHYLLDNKGLNKQQLLNEGVLDKNITVSPYCTVEDKDLFFSFRRNRDGRRNITIIKRIK